MDLRQVCEDIGEPLRRRVVLEALITLALSVGCWFTFFSMFPNPVGTGLTTILVTVLPLVLYACCVSKFLSRFLVFYVFAITAVYFVIFYKTVWNGILVMVNLVIEVVNNRTGAGIVPFSMSGDASGWSSDVFAAMIPIILLVSMAIVHSVFNKEPMVGFIFTLIPVLTGVILKMEPNLWLLILLVMGWIVMLILAAGNKPISHKKNRPIYIQKQRNTALPYVFMIIMLIVVSAYVLIFSADDYRPPQSIDGMKEACIQMEEHIRYENKNYDSVDKLSRGNLDDTHPLSYTDTPVFKLRMDMPTSMYLRKFVGSNFIGNSWIDEIEGAYSGEYQGISEWLSQNNFYPWMQQDSIYRMSKNYDYVGVSVKNIAQSSKYMYVPYEAAISGDLLPSETNYKRDYAAFARGLKGKREYSFKTFLRRMADYDESEIYSWINELKRNPNWEKYSQTEKVYRKFVYDTYLDNEYLELVSGIGSKDRLGKSINYVLSDIRKTFDDEYTYDISYEGAPQGSGELEYFLKDSKTGNDMYFATAATLMLRAAGIPARYAEGYYISPEFVETLTEMDTVRIDVTDSLAHSWVEIYIDNIGWFPVEVVPGFYNMRKHQIDDKEDSEKINEDKTKNYEDEVPEDSDDDKKAQKDKKKKISPAFFVILAFILLILIYEFVGRHFVKRRYTLLITGRDEETVYQRFRYLSKVLEFTGHSVAADPYDNAEKIEDALAQVGVGNDSLIDYMEFLRMTEAVRFGGKILTENEHKEMADYILDASSHLYEFSNGFRKFIMKYVIFLV